MIYKVRGRVEVQSWIGTTGDEEVTFGLNLNGDKGLSRWTKIWIKTLQAEGTACAHHLGWDMVRSWMLHFPFFVFLRLCVYLFYMDFYNTFPPMRSIWFYGSEGRQPAWRGLDLRGFFKSWASGSPGSSLRGHCTLPSRRGNHCFMRRKRTKGWAQVHVPTGESGAGDDLYLGLGSREEVGENGEVSDLLPPAKAE